MAKKNREQSPAEAETEAREPAKAMTKAKAIREALDSGLEDIQEIISFVKDKHNLEVAAQNVYQEKAKRSPAKNAGPTKSKGVQLTDLVEAAKKLKDELGPDEAKRLIDML